MGFLKFDRTGINTSPYKRYVWPFLSFSIRVWEKEPRQVIHDKVRFGRSSGGQCLAMGDDHPSFQDKIEFGRRSGGDGR